MMDSFWLKNDPLILASKSSARRTLLQNAGVPLTVRATDIDERAIELEMARLQASPRDIAQGLSRHKAMAVQTYKPGQMILSCDQTLDLAGVTFSKPAARKDAESQLRTLSGQSHLLHSAATLMRDGVIVAEIVSSVSLKMRPFQMEFVSSYLNLVGIDAYSSVGAYQIEGPGIHLFEEIAGDHFSIMGLPLLPILKVLRTEGFLAA